MEFGFVDALCFYSAPDIFATSHYIKSGVILLIII